ncbi:hypothetical protein BKA93DRAFT_711361, partial [Sparassis latifolia]
FTGCLAHADITRVEGNQPAFLRVVGYFEHDEQCSIAVIKRFPAVPLHPHVYEVAVRQLREGRVYSSIGQIRNKNMDMVQQQTYREQRTTDPNTSNHRYQILPGDFSRLYRYHYRETFGIDVSIAPEHNVDNWMNPQSIHFKREIYDAVFHYAPRADRGERLKVCISTQEMRDGAWKYCHKRQLVLDGTFGLCTSRLLLWIAMGIDESGSGLPVAMFLFSAPTGNKATHAGYDTHILAKLLGEWNKWLGNDSDGNAFEPAVGMTDTDTKERGALLIVWENILLLLCKFHVRQCWTNKRSALLGKTESYWRTYVEKRLQILEEALLQSTKHNAATQLVDRQDEDFRNIIATDTQAKAAGEAGLKFIVYLRQTWMPVDLWQSWSKRGREDAATKMGIPIDEVLPTTNHLEAFNGSLKKSHL